MHRDLDYQRCHRQLQSLRAFTSAQTFSIIRISVSGLTRYYMSMNVFNAPALLSSARRPFAFDRAKMLAGLPATFITTGITGGSGDEAYPARGPGRFDPAPAGAPASFVEFPGSWQHTGSFTSTSISLRRLNSTLYSLRAVRRPRASPCFVPRPELRTASWERRQGWMASATV